VKACNRLVGVRVSSKGTDRCKVIESNKNMDGLVGCTKQPRLTRATAKYTVRCRNLQCLF